MDLATPAGRQELGRRIQTAIMQAGYESLPAFARAWGCSRALIYQYAKGDVLIPLDRLQSLAEKTGQPLEWFLARGPSAQEAEERLRRNLAEVQRRLEQAEAALAREREERLRRTEQARAALLAAVRDLARAYRRGGETANLLEVLPRYLELAEEAADGRAATEAYLLLGHAWYGVGNYAKAEQALREALRRAQANGEDAMEESARQELVRVLQASGRVEEAREQAVALAQANRWWPRWAGLVAQAALDEQTGRLQAAAEALQQAAQVIEEGEEPPTRVLLARTYLTSNQVNLALAQGDYAAALTFTHTHRTLAAAAHLPDQLREAALNEAVALLKMGDLDEAGVRLARLSDWAALAGDTRIAVLARVFESERLRQAHQLPAARKVALEALEQAREGQSGQVIAEAELALGQVYAEAGQRAEARHYLEHARDRAERLRLRKVQLRAELALAQIEENLLQAQATRRQLAEIAANAGFADLAKEALGEP